MISEDWLCAYKDIEMIGYGLGVVSRRLSRPMGWMDCLNNCKPITSHSARISVSFTLRFVFLRVPQRTHRSDHLIAVLTLRDGLWNV